MPVARVQLPDGRIARIQVPEGTTPEQILEFTKNNLSQNSTQQAQAQQQPESKSLTSALFGGTPENKQEQEANKRAFGLAGRNVIQGVGNLGAFPSDMLGLGVNSLVGKEVIPSLSGMVSETLTNVGFPEPRTTGERLSADVIQGLTGGAGIGKNIAQRFAGGLSGATSGGASGVAREAGASPATQIALGLTAGMATGRGVGAAQRALAKKEIVPNSQQLRSKASDLYKFAEQKGGVLNENFTNKFLEKVDKLKPQSEIGKTLAGESAFTKMTEKLQNIRNKPITLDAAQEVDELLGDAIDDFFEAGSLKKQGKKLLDVQTEFRELIDKADGNMISGGKEGFEAIKQARKLWGTSRKISDIERIIQRAELMDNPVTGIKTGFRTLLTNPAKARGYTKEERKLIEEAANTGLTQEFLRSIGSKLVPIISFSTGGVGSGMLTQGVSGVAREIMNSKQLKKAEEVARTIANNGKALTTSKPTGGAINTLPGSILGSTQNGLLE